MKKRRETLTADKTTNLQSPTPHSRPEPATMKNDEYLAEFACTAGPRRLQRRPGSTPVRPHDKVTAIRSTGRGPAATGYSRPEPATTRGTTTTRSPISDPSTMTTQRQQASTETRPQPARAGYDDNRSTTRSRTPYSRPEPATLPRQVRGLARYPLRRRSCTRAARRRVR